MFATSLSTGTLAVIIEKPMRKVYIVLIILFSLKSLSQNLPTEFAEGFSFPIGSKFTIKLDTTNPDSIKYSIIKFEAFTTEIDSWDNDKLFNKEGEEGTIDFYFCIGSSGETEAEKEKNKKVHLLFKNRTKFALSYSSEIQITENGKYEKTSNVGSYPGAKGNEMWPYMIYSIGLKEFKVTKQ